MARRFLADVDILGFSLLNARLHPVSSNPAGLGVGDAGRVWYNTTTNRFMVWNGTAAVDLLDLGSATGTTTASKISDFMTQVFTARLDQLADPTAAVDLNNQRINNLLDPASNQDAATKVYVDTALSGLASGQVLKGTVKVAATTNINIASPGATIDGVTMAANDVVLLTGQTTGSQNGPYVWNGAASTLVRATNWDTTAEAVLGSYWIVQQGTNADTFALLTNDTAITLGTTVPTFVFRGAAGASYSAGLGIGLSGTSFFVGAGTGLVQDADGLSIDPAIVARRVVGNVPATTSGIFTVSGSSVTINHALNNAAVRVTVRIGATPPAIGGTTGELVEVTDVAPSGDVNNVTITLPAAPAAGNYVVSVIG